MLTIARWQSVRSSGEQEHEEDHRKCAFVLRCAARGSGCGRHPVHRCPSNELASLLSVAREFATFANRHATRQCGQVQKEKQQIIVKIVVPRDTTWGERWSEWKRHEGIEVLQRTHVLGYATNSPRATFFFSSRLLLGGPSACHMLNKNLMNEHGMTEDGLECVWRSCRPATELARAVEFSQRAC